MPRPDYRRKHASRVPGGNRPGKGGTLTSTGGIDRPRLSTTLPVETLEQLDTLALAHDLQRNEVLTLALAALAHPEHAHPQAAKRFRELAAAWEGFSQGVQAPLTSRPHRSSSSTRPGKLDAAAKDRIRYHLAQEANGTAPRGWMTALARELGCTTGAVSHTASKLRQAP
jgi:hypothetical protein